MIQNYMILQPVGPQYKRTCTVPRNGVIHGILYFNTSKCKVLHIGKDNLRNGYKMKVETNLVSVQTCTEEKDLALHSITY